jgi:hypothetical protein
MLGTQSRIELNWQLEGDGKRMKDFFYEKKKGMNRAANI